MKHPNIFVMALGVCSAVLLGTYQVQGTASLIIPPSFEQVLDEKGEDIPILVVDDDKSTQFFDVIRGNDVLVTEVESCQVSLDECLFHVRALAAAISDEESESNSSLRPFNCPVCEKCEEHSCGNSPQQPASTCEFSENDKHSLLSQLNAKEAELDVLRVMIKNITDLNSAVFPSCPSCPDKEEITIPSKQHITEVDESACQHELLASTEKYKELEKMLSTIDIRYKMVKNELHVEKLNNDQQRLSLEAAKLEHDAKVDSLQKEISRLNAVLVEARKTAKTVKSLEKDTNQLGQETHQCNLGFAISNLFDFGLFQQQKKNSAENGREGNSPSSEPHTVVTPPIAQSVTSPVLEVIGNESNRPLVVVVGNFLNESFTKRLFPAIVDFVKWEYGGAFRIGYNVFKFLQSAWLVYGYPGFMMMSNLFHLGGIQNHLVKTPFNVIIKPRIDVGVKLVEDYCYQHHWNEVYENHLEQYVDFIIDKANFFAYYGFRIFQGHESPMIIVDYMSNLLDSVSTISQVQNALGGNNRYVVRCVFGVVLLCTLFFLRRLIAGLILAAVGLTVLPLSLLLYILLKVLSFFYERKGISYMKVRKTKSGSKTGRESSRRRHAEQ